MSAAPEPSASTRDRILVAALAAFADRGVEATSLDAVAVEVGVRKQTVLYWFPSKEQLLFAVVDHAVADLGSRLGDAALAAGPELDRQVVAVVDATFRLGTTHPQLLAVVREVARLGPPASTHLAAAVEPLVAVASSALVPDASPGLVPDVSPGLAPEASHGLAPEVSHGLAPEVSHGLAPEVSAGLAPGVPAERERVRRVLLAAGARVVGLVTEAEVRDDLGLPADLAWLRARRRALVESLLADLR